MHVQAVEVDPANTVQRDSYTDLCKIERAGVVAGREMRIP